MIPKIIHYCWFGENTIPEKYSAYIEDWKNIHKGWDFIFWQESDCPAHIPYVKRAIESKKWANLSNFIRLYALQTYGGIYLDIDVKLIKPLNDLITNECFLGFEEGFDGDQTFWINNAIMGAKPSHSLIVTSYESLINEFDGIEQANLSGPRLITKVLQEKYNVTSYGFQKTHDITIYPKEYFYPIHYSEVYKLEEIHKYIKPETYAVHMWARTWLDNTSLLKIVDELYFKINQLESESVVDTKSLNEPEQKLKTELKISLVSLLEKTSQNNFDILQIKNLLISYKNEVTLINENFQQKNNHLEKLERENIKLLDKIEIQETSLQNQNKLLEAKNEETLKLQAKLEATNACISTHQLLEVQLKKQNEELITKEQHLSSLYNEFIKSKDNEIEFLKRIYSEISIKYKEISEKEKDLLSNLHNTEVNLLKSDHSIKRLEMLASKANENNRIIDELNEKVTQKDLIITNLELELNNLSDQNQAISEKLQAAKKEITQLTAELSKSVLTNKIDSVVEIKEKEIELLKDQLQNEKNNNKSYSKAIQWYKETYEYRSLAGILKEYLTKKVHKFIPIQKLLKGYYKVKKTKNRNQKTKKILCTIVNYDCSENARRLSKNLNKYFDTIIFDSGSKEVHSSFVKLGNVYYSGLLNNSYYCAKDLGYEYMFFICSDVEFESVEIDKMYSSLNEINIADIGIYSPSSTGRSHLFCKKVFEKGLRAVPFTEGFVFLADLKVLDKFLPIDLHINQYGWGPDIANGYYSRVLDKLCVIDDGVTVYHPESTGYSNQKAEEDMWHWLNSFEDKNFKRFFTTYINLIRSGNLLKHKVSVIIPCYNQEAYLPETIKSLLLQEYTNLEILIINDGSNDDTETISFELSKQYPQIKYLSKQNGGLGSARNHGLNNASGDLIQFLDSDDTLSTDKILSQVIQFLAVPDTDVSYTPYICFEDGNKSNTWTYSRVILKDDPLEDLIENWEKDLSIPVHCFIYKKNLIDSTRFDTELPNHEDWHYHIQIAAKKGNYAFIDQGIAFYRVRNNSMARDKDLMKKGKQLCIEKSMKIDGVSNYYQEKLKSRAENPLTITTV